MSTTNKPSVAGGWFSLSLGTLVLLMSLHPNVWGFWAMFLDVKAPRPWVPGFWLWPVAYYGFTVGMVAWGARQLVLARRRAR